MPTAVISSVASTLFAQELAFRIGAPELSVDRHQFPGGERYLRLGLDDRAGLMSHDVVIVASTDTDDDLNELYRVGCAAAGYGSRRRIFVIPFFGYSTMERASKPGEVVTAKAIARQLSSIPNTGLGNTFLLLDPHTSGLIHYFEGDCVRYELYAETVLLKAITDLRLKRFMFGTADLGRPKWVKSFARHFGTSIAVVDQDRDFTIKGVFAVIGDVRDQTVVIYDDMIRSATTLINAAKAYKAHGAADIYAVTSHLALTDPSVIDRLRRSPIEHIIATNSHPMAATPLVTDDPLFTIVEVAPVFADVIRPMLD